MSTPEEVPMVFNLSQSLICSLNAGMQYNATESLNQDEFINNDDLLKICIISIINLLIGLLGLVGNGIFIWFLMYHITKNPFSIYILNLSIADFGLLTVQTIYMISLNSLSLSNTSFLNCLHLLYNTTFIFILTTSQFLLIVIIIVRSVCFFFPLWYQFHQPPRLSTAVCAIIWILTFLISVTNIILSVTIKYFAISGLQFYLNTVIFMPIMCVPTIAILIKICLKSQRKKCGKLLRAILLVLVFFFFFVFPINIIHFISIFQNVNYSFFLYSSICASLNSTINPIIYYLVGRDKMGRSSKRIDKVLKELFKEDEVYREEQEASAAVQL